MASPDELAAIFASAWTAGAGSHPSPTETVRLAQLWAEAKRKQPGLDERDFAIGLAGLAPGPEGLAAYLGSEAALDATLARGTVAPIGLAGTIASGAPPANVAGATRNVPERYRVIRQLGAGAMGVVWEAEDRQLHRKVALKWVTPNAAGDRGYRVRLLREARALAQIHHPNVMAVYDAGESGDELYLALELIEGTTAREAPPSIEIWRQAGAGLAAVHAAGLIHRDIKPENVFVAKDGRVVVGDFGLATGDLGETMATNLTATGAVVGTPLYMPPEQLHGDPATAKGDQFSLCVCFWEALAGKRPFDSTSIAGLAVAMLKPPPIPPGVDRRIFAALARGLSPEPEQRWPDVPALLAALAPGATKKRGSMIAIGAALAVGAVGAITLMQLTRKDAPAAPTPVPAPPTAPATPPTPPAAPEAPSAAAGGTPTATAPPTIATPKAPAGSGAPRPSGHPKPATKVADAEDDDTGAKTPYTKPTWRAHYDDSITAMQTGDGKKCLALIADRATWPASASRELLSVEAGLGACMMAAGDCEGGHKALEAFGAKHNLTAADIARRIAFSDAKYCALEAPPRSFWPTRAAAQLEKLAYARQSCTAVLQFIDANHLVLAADPARPLQMVMCLVADGKCTEARTTFLKDRAPTATGQMLDIANHSFDLSFPSCAGT